MIKLFIYLATQGLYVLIIGGGDGGTLTQVLSNSQVERVVMVEIDQHVVAMAKKYFPELSKGFGDPRATLIFQDGAEWVRTQRTRVLASPKEGKAAEKRDEEKGREGRKRQRVTEENELI